MRYLSFIRHSEKYRETTPPSVLMAAVEVIGGWAILNASAKAEAVRIASDFMELHRKHWPEFEGESEVRQMSEPGMGP